MFEAQARRLQGRGTLTKKSRPVCAESVGTGLVHTARFTRCGPEHPSGDNGRFLPPAFRGDGTTRSAKGLWLQCHPCRVGSGLNSKIFECLNFVDGAATQLPLHTSASQLQFLNTFGLPCHLRHVGRMDASLVRDLHRIETTLAPIPSPET